MLVNKKKKEADNAKEGTLACERTSDPSDFQSGHFSGASFDLRARPAKALEHAVEARLVHNSPQRSLGTQPPAFIAKLVVTYAA